MCSPLSVLLDLKRLPIDLALGRQPPKGPPILIESSSLTVDFIHLCCPVRYKSPKWMGARKG